MSDLQDKKDTKEKVAEKPKATESEKTESTVTEKVSDVVSDLTDKIPKLSELGNKFDLDKILGGIKSLVGADEDSTIKADPSDALGVKVEKLSALLKELNQSHAQITKDFEKANALLVSLFKDLEAVRAEKKD